MACFAAREKTVARARRETAARMEELPLWASSVSFDVYKVVLELIVGRVCMCAELGLSQVVGGVQP